MGEYSNAIDEKGRAIFPSKFRKLIGEEFIITKGLDGCIAAYHLDEWKKIEEKIDSMANSKSRFLKRFLFAGATKVLPDKQGRILFPQPLREYALLEKAVVFIGISSSIEIWDSTRWEEVQEKLTQDMVEQTMDELDF